MVMKLVGAHLLSCPVQKLAWGWQQMCPWGHVVPTLLCITAMSSSQSRQ